jgi:cytochrome c biogenesis protein CcdA
MHTLLASVVAIAALDSLNPTAVALQIYLLSTPKPMGRAIVFTLGVFSAYWVCGLLVTCGFGQLITTMIANFNGSFSEDYLYVGQLLIGIVLLSLGLRLEISTSANSEKRPQNLTISRTFLLGLGVTIWEFPTALPYLAAIEQIVRARLDLFTTMSVLALYNLIFILPLIVLVIIYSLFQQQSASLLDRINRSIATWSPKILRVLIIGLGIILIVDSLAYSFGQPFLQLSLF